MSWFAIAHGRYDPQAGRRISGVAAPYLRRPALTDFACAIRRLARIESCPGSATIRASPLRGPPGRRYGRPPSVAWTGGDRVGRELFRLVARVRKLGRDPT